VYLLLASLCRSDAFWKIWVYPSFPNAIPYKNNRLTIGLLGLNHIPFGAARPHPYWGGRIRREYDIPFGEPPFHMRKMLLPV